MPVYFARAGKNGPVKIGYAVKPWERVRQMQTGFPDRLVLLAIVDGGPDVERHYHRAFADSRLRGEWFLMSDDMENFILEQPRLDMLDEGTMYPERRAPPGEKERVIWFDRTIESDRQASIYAHYAVDSLRRRFGPSGRRKRKLTSKQAKKIGKLAVEARRRNRDAKRLPDTEARAIWLDVKRYPLSRDALTAMKWPSYVTAWRAFGPRE